MAVFLDFNDIFGISHDLAVDRDLDSLVDGGLLDCVIRPLPMPW
jgi:hypothetical protein